MVIGFRVAIGSYRMVIGIQSSHWGVVEWLLRFRVAIGGYRLVIGFRIAIGGYRLVIGVQSSNSFAFATASLAFSA